MSFPEPMAPAPCATFMDSVLNVTSTASCVTISSTSTAMVTSPSAGTELASVIRTSTSDPEADPDDLSLVSTTKPAASVTYSPASIEHASVTTPTASSVSVTRGVPPTVSPNTSVTVTSSTTSVSALTSDDVTFIVGETFQSLAELERKVKSYEDNKFVKFWRRDSRTIEAAKKRVARPLKADLKYYQLKFCCINGGQEFRPKSKGHRTSS